MNGQFLFISPPEYTSHFLTSLSVKEMLKFKWVDGPWWSSYVYLTLNNVIYIKIK